MDTVVETQGTSTQEDLRPHVLVGVDGRHVNDGAVRWAASEATRSHLAVRLTTICRVLPEAEVYLGREIEDSTRAALQETADRLAGDVDVLPVSVSTGSPVLALLDRAADAELLVVGHRDLGALHRSTLGSTSIAVAGRSKVTVVVVPDDWSSEGRAHAPVVVGLRLPEDDDEPDHPASLAYAFDRARALQVPLVVVHAWEVPAILTWSPVDVATEQDLATTRVGRLLVPWRDRYPDVALEVRSVAERPADALRDAAATGQLVVLGRRTAPDRHGGFRLGSTARAFLHHAETPVAVVPAEGGRAS
ncbi:MAG: universal stress protein [Nocardioidaceae bacterium]